MDKLNPLGPLGKRILAARYRAEHYWDDRCTMCGVRHPIYQTPKHDPWIRAVARPA